MNSPIKVQWLLYFLIIFTTLISCTESRPAMETKLPYLGFHDINGSDTAYHKIPDFTFFNQDSIKISNQNLSSSVYLADFFYTYCPTICPKVKNQMLRIYDKFQNDNRLKLVSFALDPKRDNVEHLNFYSKNLGVKSDKWYFLTGEKDEIWELADDFLISVKEDSEEPGGIYHSGKIILIDQEGHIRGFVDGTSEEQVSDFMDDVELLLNDVSRN